MDAAASLATIRTVQVALGVVQMLNLTAHRYPPPCSLTNSSKFDFIIVGSGTAGSVLANRLSKNSNVAVALIETGGFPPVEAEDFPGLISILPRSVYDFNYTAQDDNRTAQNLQDRAIGVSQGKVLGGSGTIQHALHVQGNPEDFNNYAKILRDDSWNYTNVLPYFKKIENLVDEELLASPDAKYHGTNGLVKITRIKFCENIKYLDAFSELGHKIVNDTSAPSAALGFTEPLYSIADGLRQSTSLTYLQQAKCRKNLCLSLFTTATKILIQGGVAIGVQVTLSNGDVYVLYANKEVIVSAGAINSPKLLMLSGVGPASHLNSLNITVQVDLPVGQKFMDHPSAFMAYQMDKSTGYTTVDPHVFPIQTMAGNVAFNTSQTFPDYNTIDLIFPRKSSVLLQLCSNIFKYTNEICQKLYNASEDRNLLVAVINLMMPKSYGEVLLASTDPKDDPLIYPGTYSNDDDLDMMVKSMIDFNKVVNTTFFKSVNASMVDVGLCSPEKKWRNERKFWKCYALSMSATMWHYCGTCAMGSVLNSKFQVKGIQKLRVVDSSAMPTLTRGKINAAVAMLAERAADIILSAWGIH